MPRIRCHYMDCIFIDEGYCSATAVDLDPDTGCTTYSPTEADIENWDEDDLDDWDSEGEEDDDLWLDEDGL